MKKQIIKYSFEFIVIMLGILISLFLEQRRQNSIEAERKNNNAGNFLPAIKGAEAVLLFVATLKPI